MTKKQRLEALIEHYSSGSKSQFARKLGVTAQGISTWLARNTFDIDLVYSKCEDVSPEWLLTGRGEMLRKDNREDITATLTPDYTGIPVIPTEAMAGFLTGEVSVYEDTCERVTIPGLKADFIIPVSGDSMQPLYFSGDYVACQHVNLGDIFFQWGRVYVINTSQGVLIKKVRRSGSNDTILLISENPDYDPFELPLTDIYQISIVKGLIRIV